MFYQGTRKVISNRSPESFTEIKPLLLEIASSTSNLRILSRETNFMVPEQRENFKQNITYLRSFYWQAERIITNAK